jgi:hypothetical protein
MGDDLEERGWHHGDRASAGGGELRDGLLYSGQHPGGFRQERRLAGSDDR